MVREKLEPTYEEPLNTFVSLTDELLAPAVQHTETWKRAMYDVALVSEFYEQLMRSKFGDLVIGHTNPDTGEKYSTGVPDRVIIVAEQLDHNKYPDASSKETALEIDLRYYLPGGQGEDFDDIRILVSGASHATSYVFSSKDAETGYEGHDRRTQVLDSGELQNFYGLVAHSTKTQIPEKPLEAWLEAIRLVDEQTGDEFYYDRATRSWQIRGGETMGSKVGKGQRAYGIYVETTYQIKPIRDENT